MTIGDTTEEGPDPRFDINFAEDTPALDDVPYLDLDESFPVDELVPYENNPRLITDEDVTDLAASISAVGFFGDPIVICRRNNVIISGHRRRLAAMKLGWKFVPVLKANVSTSQADQLRLSMNKLGESVQWDKSALADEIMKLDGFGVGISQLGFSEPEVVGLFQLEMKGGGFHLGQMASVHVAGGFEQAGFLFTDVRDERQSPHG